MEFKITYPNKEDIEKTNAFALVAFGDPEAGMVAPNMENAQIGRASCRERVYVLV